MTPVFASIASLKISERRVFLVPLLFFLYVGGVSSITTFVAIYLVREQGMSATLVGIGLLGQNIVRALLAPFAGAASDRYGRRTLLIASAVLSALVTPGFLLVHDPRTLLVWSIAVGVVHGPFVPVGIALLLDLTPMQRRQGMVALNTTVMNVGYTFSVAPAGYLVDLGFGWLAVWSATLFFAASVAVVAFVRGDPPRVTIAGDPRLLAVSLHAFRDRTFLLLALLSFTFPLSLGLLVSVLPLYAADLGVPGSIIGLLLSLNGVVVAALVLPLNLSVERFGPFRPLWVAAVVTALAELALRDGSHVSLVVAVVGISLSEAVFSVALVSAVAMLTPPGARGAYQGALGLVLSIGSGSALFLAGVVRSALSWEMVWTTFAVATLLSAVVLANRAQSFARVASARAAV